MLSLTSLPLTAPAVPSINGDLEESLGLTPKTAADLAAKRDNQPNPAKKPKLRKQVVDAVTELEWQAGRSQVVRFKEVSCLSRARSSTESLTALSFAALLPAFIASSPSPPRTRIRPLQLPSKTSSSQHGALRSPRPRIRARRPLRSSHSPPTHQARRT